MEHHQLAKKAACESTVLLKNEEKILPLPANAKIAIIGDFAIEPRYQGAGSSMVNPTFSECVKKAIDGYEMQVIGISRGYRRSGGKMKS